MEEKICLDNMELDKWYFFPPQNLVGWLELVYTAAAAAAKSAGDGDVITG